MNLDKGGRGAIERMVEAYGFTTRQALCEQLGISKSTLATRYMRDSFPAEWVIQCSLETGASLQWLTNGQGKIFGDKSSDLTEIRHIKLIEGKSYEAGSYIFDKSFLRHDFIQPLAISDNQSFYISDRNFESVIDGKWLVQIDGTHSIRDIIKLPANKIRVMNDSVHFDCIQDEVNFSAKIIMSVHR